ncbi:MAG TPA: chemotaxis protein CheD [Spirochaetota bacterium]|nr:chemotaxis protein CheD [Spirochaetota bacterium]
MHNFYDSKFKKQVISIGPGEYYTTNQDVIIQTVLGSCVAVCLFTEADDFCGMNHFMLPGDVSKNNIEDCDAGRYGMYSMEILINSLLKKGVDKKLIKAKVFGGGNVIDFKTAMKSRVGDNNVTFILAFLEEEKIPIVSNHLGGDNARKILFFQEDKRVLLKKINKTEAFNTVKEEIEYNKSIVSETTKKSNIILFD